MKYQQLKKLKTIYNYYKTKIVLFRGANRLDSFALFNATQNEDFNKYLNWQKPESIEEIIKKVDFYMTSENHIAVSFCDKEGIWCGMFVFELYEDGIMLSLWTNPKHWKTIYPIHAAFAAIDIVFKESNFNKIYAKISPSNEPMVKIVEKNGFTLIDKTKTLHSSGNLILADMYLLDQNSWTENIKDFYIKNEKY